MSRTRLVVSKEGCSYRPDVCESVASGSVGIAKFGGIFLLFLKRSAAAALDLLDLGVSLALLGS